jgi:YbgC/YbaW family acyl-CoA thioester hydrolase
MLEGPLENSGLNSPTLETDVRVMFFDTDAGRVVHNIAYLRFIETNRTLLGEKLGFRFGAMMDQGECPVVVRTEIDYRKPARLWDDLKITGSLEKFERSRFWCAFTITRPADGQLLVNCRQMLAVVKLPEMTVVRLPKSWTTDYADLTQLPSKGDLGGIR